MTTQTTSYEVFNGPSREELFDGLRLRHEQRTVPFSYKNSAGKISMGIRFVIDSIEAEDGSGESWNVKARCESLGRVKLYFSTQRRKGIFSRIP